MTLLFIIITIFRVKNRQYYGINKIQKGVIMENKVITEQEKFEKSQKVMSDKIKLIADLINNDMLKAAKIEIQALKKYLDFELSSAKKQSKNSF